MLSNVATSNYLPKIITNYNKYFDTTLQMLSKTQPAKLSLPNSPFIIGDGGRLISNGTYGNGEGYNVTRIGVADLSATNAGAKNTQILMNMKKDLFITYFFPNKIIQTHTDIFLLVMFL